MAIVERRRASGDTICAVPYLIDGHNLIGQMPGLSLDDPHDEAKLAMHVRRFCVHERRKATIIFDGGLPGGVSRLSNSDVTVIFASDRRTTADDLLLNRIRNERNPGGLIVVTSDQKIANAARQRRMTVKPSREFAREVSRAAKAARGAGAEKERGLSKEELEEWEAMFGKGKG
ncbi:MAG: hypothetical protein FJ030_09435 [Chloroflexi bacterium]|nr:hypothetical protein [Chloroflexota bacterium]